MGLGREWYNAIHGDRGDVVTNSIMLALMIAISLFGVRRELSPVARSGA